MHLTEHDLAFLAMECPPNADTSLQRPAHTARQMRMAPKHLFQYRYRPDVWSGPQQRNYLSVKYPGQWILASALARRLLLRW